MDAREIIFDYFDNAGDVFNNDFKSLMDYLDTDTLVAWFVDEGYVDGIEEEDFIMEYYSLHCGR